MSVLRSFEVDARFLPKRRGHNEQVQVVVGLKADAH
jgi:hypothetical protein